MSRYIYLFVFFTSTLFSQNTFEKTYGGSLDEDSYAAAETRDGGFIIAGSTKSFGAGNFDFYIIRINSAGDTVWTRTFGSPQYEKACDIVKTEDSLYVIAGYTSEGNGDVWLIKINENGDSIWTKVIGTVKNDHITKIKNTPDGGFILCGDNESYGRYTAWLVKTNSYGDTLWTNSFYYGTANDIDLTPDGGYILMIYPYSSTIYRYDYQILKTDGAGDSLWTKYYGGSGIDIGYSVQCTKDGGFILGGRSSSFTNGSDDFFMIKTNSQGDSLWSKNYGGSGIDRSFALKQTADEGYILGGFTASFDIGSFDFYIVKTNSGGDTLWTRTYGGNAEEQLLGIMETSDGGFAGIGYTYSFGAGSFPDIYFVRTNSQGLLSDIHEQHSSVQGFHLYQNYPNPFNPQTTLRYNINSECAVSIRMFDILGNEIRVLVNEIKKTGIYSIIIDGKELSSGTYIINMIAGNFRESRKIVLLK